MPCAFALHLAFPRTNLPLLAPLALAGLFTSWMSLGPRAAAALGYASGLVFFALGFSWFGETAGALLGPMGFVVDLGPAVVEALAFALAAAIAAHAARRFQGIAVPVVVAAAFTFAELLRSSGPLGVPLYQIGAAFVETPLAPIAAFAGVYGLTFVVALAAAGLAALGLSLDRHPERGTALRQLGAIVLGIGLAAGGAWLAWPARHAPAPTLRVAAVQGNITQSVKWNARSLPLAVDRYSALTLTLRSFKPQFVLWPETVITTDLLLDPELATLPGNARLDAEGARLRARFGDLARTLGTELAVGSDEAAADTSYNDLFFFAPSGTLERRYRKRQLVPFAEFLPGPGWLRGVPFASLVSNFGAGRDGAPIGSLHIAPLICWEAGFSDLAQGQAAAGADFFAVATDDAWFGDSDGPYAQAQLAQLRAIETGRWIVRAAATGVSGIVAPDGHWQARSALDTVAVVMGTIGEPQPTAYARSGPWPIGAALGILLVLGWGVGERRRVR